MELHGFRLYIKEVDGVLISVANSDPEYLGLEVDDEGSIAAARDGVPFVGYYIDEFLEDEY